MISILIFYINVALEKFENDLGNAWKDLMSILSEVRF